MTIYVDLVFLINFIMDFYILSGVKFLLKLDTKLVRIILGSLIGSFSLFFLFFSLSIFILNLLKIIISVIMVFVTFGKYNFFNFKKRACRNVNFCNNFCKKCYIFSEMWN